MGPGGDSREEAAPALLLFLQRKTHYGASMFLLSGSVPSELLSQGSASASLTGHTWDHVLVPPDWEGGSCPSLPLCSPQRAQRGTRCFRTRFSFIPADSWLFLAFPLALFQFTGVWPFSSGSQDFRTTWGFPHRQTHGFMAQRKCQHLHLAAAGWEPAPSCISHSFPGSPRLCDSADCSSSLLRAPSEFSVPLPLGSQCLQDPDPPLHRPPPAPCHRRSGPRRR